MFEKLFKRQFDINRHINAPLLEERIKYIQSWIDTNHARNTIKIAKNLHTTTSAISRLENSGGKKRHSPTIETLRKYAKALNCSLRIQFVPFSKA